MTDIRVTNFIKCLREQIRLRLEAEKVEFTPSGSIHVTFVTGIRPTIYRYMEIRVDDIMTINNIINNILPADKVEQIKRDVFGE